MKESGDRLVSNVERIDMKFQLQLNGTNSFVKPQVLTKYQRELHLPCVVKVWYI
jgi:hypothetical protein